MYIYINTILIHLKSAGLNSYFCRRKNFKQVILLFSSLSTSIAESGSNFKVRLIWKNVTPQIHFKKTNDYFQL